MFYAISSIFGLHPPSSLLIYPPPYDEILVFWRGNVWVNCAYLIFLDGTNDDTF